MYQYAAGNALFYRVSSTLLRVFFDSSSEKPPIFRSRPEEDPKRTRRNAG
ncbi:hypothetical protein [Chryseobacterium gregarium]|nr:hypothetical protein [Chryseobacterium gregarium]